MAQRNPHELTIAEEKFCSVFIATGSGEQAFEAAYGYSRISGKYTNADAVKKKPRVQLKIMELRAEYIKKLEINRDTVISELAAIAFARDISTYLDYDADSVRLRPLSELTPTEAKAIKSVVVLPNGGIKLELYDKLAAQAQLCKVLGLASGDTNISLNHFVIKAPEAVATGVEWEAMASAAAVADEVEAATRLLPATVEPVEPAESQAAVYGTGEPAMASGGAPLAQALPSGRSADELQVLPKPLKLGGHRRGY